MGALISNSLDLDLSVKAEKVLLGRDLLGGGEMLAGISDGRFHIEDLNLRVPDGRVQAEFSYHPTGNTADVSIKTKVDILDYGILARQVNPKSEMDSLISIDAAVETTVANIEPLLSNGSGRLKFAIWPRDFEAGGFDLWTVSLLSLLLPKVDAED